MKLFISLFLSVMSITGIYAQKKSLNEHRDSIYNTSIKALKKSLNLSIEQEVQIKQARQEETACMDSIMKSFIPSSNVFKTKVSGCHEVYQKRFLNILSSSQLKEYRKREKEILEGKKKQ